jgi:CubicO group peptidase (beta-lactamase class C family)
LLWASTKFFFALVKLRLQHIFFRRRDHKMDLHFHLVYWIALIGILLESVNLVSGQQQGLSNKTVWDPSVQANAPQEWNFNSGSQQVWYGDTLIYENYLGKKSIEYNADFTFDTQFRICSNSKLFVAVSIMQLVERGVIGSIHDNINDYLNITDYEAWGLPKGTTQWCPTIWGDTTKTCQNVTFVSLMSMSSGVIAAITCSYSPSN